jgi:hypothetical protein
LAKFAPLHVLAVNGDSESDSGVDVDVDAQSEVSSENELDTIMNAFTSDDGRAGGRNGKGGGGRADEEHAQYHPHWTATPSYRCSPPI